MAAPPIKPTMAAWDKKSIKKPNLITKMKYHHFLMEEQKLEAVKMAEAMI